MVLIKRVIRLSIYVIIPLTLLSALIDWKSENLRFIRLFGNPDLLTTSIIIGGILGVANLKGLEWGIEGLLGTYKASTRLIFISLLRLAVLFSLIIVLAAFRLINFLGLLTGMAAVFLILITEGLKMAKKHSSE